MPAPMWLFLIPGVAMVLLSIPLMLRRVPPNPLGWLRANRMFRQRQTGAR